MAIRYSGSLVIRVVYDDADSSYTARIHERGQAFKAIVLTHLRLAPVCGGLAVDSSEAYDLATHAALGFASHDCEDVWAYADCTSCGDGFYVSRKAGV